MGVVGVQCKDALGELGQVLRGVMPRGENGVVDGGLLLLLSHVCFVVFS